ncbi:MAG: alpha-L-fucosidase [Pirellulaceae bacterium]|nr:alpha-L-fucosidase [Pirellulaceae bacterium]
MLRNSCPVRFMWLLFFFAVTAGGSHGKEFVPEWYSLDQHQTPQWLKDAKVGLFVYPLHPTEDEYNKYKAKYGRLGSYKALDAWDVTPWDPDAVAQLAKDAGAKYLVFGVDAFSFFLSWPSKYADIEGSPFTTLTGPGSTKDYVAEMAAAVRQRGLKFSIYRNYLNPKNYTYFHETSYELIDRYQPATLWLDGDKTSAPAEVLRSQELAAYYYNHSERPDDVGIEDAMGAYKRRSWGRWLEHGDWYRKEMSPPHSNISDGTFVRYETLYRWRTRSPEGNSTGIVNNLVEWMVDATAKGGNIEFTIHLGPPDVYALQQRTLRQIGLWLEVNGEAIYDSHPWYDGRPEDTTSSGIPVRYTTKGDSLYATLFDWPSGKRTADFGRSLTAYQVHTEERGKVLFRKLRVADDTTIHMLGIGRELKWEQTPDGLWVHVPEGSGHSGSEPEIPCDHAFCIKMTPRPSWVRDEVDWSNAVLDRTIKRGEVLDIEGPPSDKRDRDPESHTLKQGEAMLAPRRAIANGVYQTVRQNLLAVQYPDASLEEFTQRVRDRYRRVVLNSVPPVELKDIDFEHFTLIYPSNYDGNDQAVEVPLRRITIRALDRFDDTRTIVAYFANYDKVDPKQPTVSFQVNGHFGHNPSRLGFGLEDRGGYSGAALGKIAMRGVPLITYDDHDVGESDDTPGPHRENGLFRTLCNLRMLDQALLTHFDAVDAFGLSGGTERLYHFLMFHDCKLRSAYLAGFYSPLWMPLDSKEYSGGPFGVNGDTMNVPFHSQFQWAELVLVGIHNGVRVRFMNNTYEGSTGKSAFHRELLPVLDKYSADYTVGGDDPDCDGVSNDGRNLAHEYDIPDVLKFLGYE